MSCEKPIQCTCHSIQVYDEFSHCCIICNWNSLGKYFVEEGNKSLDFLNDEKEDIYKESDGTKLEGNMDERVKEIEKNYKSEGSVEALHVYMDDLLSHITQLETQLDEWKEVASIHIHKEHELETQKGRLEHDFETALVLKDEMRVKTNIIEAKIKELEEGIKKTITYLMKWGIFGNEQELGIMLNKLYKLVEKK